MAKKVGQEICKTCGGSGNSKFECGHCKGTGKQGKAQCPVCKGRCWQPCPPCKGTGRK